MQRHDWGKRNIDNAYRKLKKLEYEGKTDRNSAIENRITEGAFS